MNGPRELLTGAAAGFDGNVTELSSATGIPQRTLYNFAAGQNAGSAALVKLLQVLAANPRIARRLCYSEEVR